MLIKPENEDTVFEFENRSFKYSEMAKMQRDCPSTRNIIEKMSKYKTSKKFQIISDVFFAKSTNGKTFVLPANISNEFLQYLHVLTARSGC